jgi:hypothetical protein
MSCGVGGRAFWGNGKFHSFLLLSLRSGEKVIELEIEANLCEESWRAG